MTGYPNRAVVLLSGGLDSAVCLAVALRDGHTCYPLSLNYGQRHRRELDAARRVASSMGVRDHRVIRLDLRAIGGSALTDDMDVPTDYHAYERDRGGGIPATYVPARNLTFLSIAAGLAEVEGAFHLYIGVNAIDYSGYPDCRPEFIASFQQTVKLATRFGAEGGNLRVETPLMSLRKHEIIRLGASLGVDFSLTHSCYAPVGDLACGRCDACVIRRGGFKQAGMQDPIAYAPTP